MSTNQLKTLSLTCLILVILGTIAHYPLCYYTGYQGDFRLLTINMMIGTASLIPIFVLTITWIISMIRKKDWLSTCKIMAGLVVFILLSLFLPASYKLIVYGMRDRLMRDYSLNDFRQFAQEVKSELNGVWINHDDTAELTDLQKAAYDRIRKKYSFLLYMNRPRLPFESSIDGDSNSEGTVGFYWGGALPGHWGCSIAVNGRRNTPPSNDRSYYLPVSDDIYFYIGD